MWLLINGRVVRLTIRFNLNLSLRTDMEIFVRFSSVLLIPNITVFIQRIEA